MSCLPRLLGHVATAAVLTVAVGTAGLAPGVAAPPGRAVARASAAESVPESAVAPAVALPGLTDCGSGTPVVRRRSFVVFCGDAGETGEHLHWARLTHRLGVARGRAVANDCTPTCAAGHDHSYRARFVFSRVRDLHGPAFTEVAITYTGRHTPYGQRHQHNRIA